MDGVGTEGIQVGEVGRNALLLEKFYKLGRRKCSQIFFGSCAELHTYLLRYMYVRCVPPKCVWCVVRGPHVMSLLFYSSTLDAQNRGMAAVSSHGYSGGSKT